MSVPQRTPSYRRHRPSGQAVVQLNGRMFYLGKWGSKASHSEYDRLLAQWMASGRNLSVAGDDLTISELAARYLKHARIYYMSTGHRGELTSIKLVLGHLRTLYGSKSTRSFGPLALKTTIASMVSAGWCRAYCNAQTQRIRRMFKWAAANELTPAEIWQALRTVEGLRRGKTEAPEAAPVKPVSDDIVTATLARVSDQVAAMIGLQLITGMRPGEVVIMRGCDIDTSRDVWVYRPSKFKTQHHDGHFRTVPLGPKAKEIIEKFLKPNPQAYLFSPAEAEATRRRSEVEASEEQLEGPRSKKSKQRMPGEHYDVDAYRRAIARGCDAAFPPPSDLIRIQVDGAKGKRWETAEEQRARLGEKKWRELREWQSNHRWHPHQLRHSAATRLRKDFGLEAAQVILGHRSLSVTEIYAEKNIEAAQRIMAQVG